MENIEIAIIVAMIFEKLGCDAEELKQRLARHYADEQLLKTLR